MAKYLTRRYIWLIDLIRSHPGGITFDEINLKWQKSILNDDGEPMPKRTFHAHLEAILEEFDIEITCDRSDGYRYKIEDEVNEYGSIRNTLVDSLVLSNAVAEMPAMKNRVFISQSFSQKNIAVILKAMQNGRVIKVRYFLDDDIKKIKKTKKAVKKDTNIDFIPEAQTNIVEPYGITYHRFWFLVCRERSTSEMLVFACERFIEVEILEETYCYPEDFNLKHFVESYDDLAVFGDRLDRDYLVLDDGISLEYYRDTGVQIKYF